MSDVKLISYTMGAGELEGKGPQEDTGEGKDPGEGAAGRRDREDGEDRRRDYTNPGVKAALQIGTYYFPAPAMLATYAVVHDRFINPSGKYYLYSPLHLLLDS